MKTLVISLGSNIDPKENVKNALHIIGQKYKTLRTSNFVMTKPIGFTQQPDFLNGSVMIETDKTVDEVNQILKQIEISLGRVCTENKCGPRTIDLDIVVWNDEIIDQDFYERDFLKTSVLELIPNLKY